MRYAVISLGLSLLTAGTVSVAQAQVVAQGQARGSFASLLDSSIGLLDTSNTGQQSATEPGSFSVVVDEDALGVPGVLEVVSGGSSTVGQTTGSNPRVDSIGGEVTADLLDGTIQAVSSSARATVSCNGAIADSRLTALTVGNESIDLPLNPQPNTVIDVAGLARIVLNSQQFTRNQLTGSASLTVDAAVIQLLDGGDLVEVRLSTAFASLSGLPGNCDIFSGDGIQNTTGGGGDGGGGCALNPSAPSTDAWPIFLLALLWILHKRRRMWEP